MLRCTLASLIPILKWKGNPINRTELLEKYRHSFESLIKNESYYILKEIPAAVLDQFFVERIPAILAKQNSRGLWKIKNGVALNLLLNSGYDGDERLKPALENLLRIEKEFGGFCDSDIKKPYLAEKKPSSQN